jgi:two-component system CheB/CheR fusion protein
MPVVGIGASAGGVDALQAFFREMPADSSMAFVVVLHLAPDRESTLAAILQSCTDMPVERATDRTEVRANRVYVITPGHRLTLRDGLLRVSDITGDHDVATIDRFFRSLAAEQGANAVGIVLSGTGSDGTIGLRSIAEGGGVAVAQAPGDAAYDEMPQSAIATGGVDLVAPAGQLANMLADYRDSAGTIQLPTQVEDLDEDGQTVFQKILARLSTVTGHDLSRYRRSAILRRLERRLELTAAQSLDEYLRRLRNDEAETRTLYRDLLARTTRFFRAPEAFAALEKQVIPALFEGKGPADQVRVWVPGCATGEEAYSLAMLLVEHADTLDGPPELQLFATDVDEEVLDEGRRGRYSEAIAADVSADRLRRFFEHKGPYYRVAPRLRERILFARHDLLTDPPFANLDLVSCRNLLPSLNEEAREDVFGRLHYSLRGDGVLFLGRDEAPQTDGSLFTTIDGPNNILQARPGSTPKRPSAPRRPAPSNGPDATDLDRMHHRVLMDTVASLLVNDNGDIVHLSDGANRYLRFDEGAPSHNLFAVAPKALRPELRGALDQALQTNRAVERTRLPGPEADASRRLRVVVQPVPQAQGGRLAHVRIEERPRPDRPADEEDDALRAELDRTRDQLQATAAEYEAAREELETSNEELRSMNEELQSKNEELQRREQELQSLNEELETTNRELQGTVEELRETNSVLENLMAATQIATLFLDRDLRIQRYTPRVTELFNVTAADVGRPLSDFTRRFEYEGLLDDARAVLDTQEPIERELSLSDDRWFLLRLRPYRTVDDRIEGVVLTFIDISSRRTAEESLRRSEEFHRLTVEAGRVGTWVVDLESGDVAISPQMADLLGNPPDAYREAPDRPGAEHWQQVVPREAWRALIHPEDRAAVDAAIDASAETGDPLELEFRIRPEDGAVRWLYSRGEVTRTGAGDHPSLRGASIDITEHKEGQEELRRERNFVDRLLDTVGALVVVLDPEGRIVRLNDEGEAILGYTEATLEGARWVERLVPDEAAPEARTVVSRLQQGEAPIQSESPVRTADGEKRLIDWTSTVLRDEAGTVRYLIGTGIDVTERRALEEEVINAGERVRREIGQDLHDVLSSDLAALALQADNLRNKVQEKHIERTETAEALHDIIDGLREAADRSRTLSHALIPVSLQDKTLTAALKNLCREQEKLTEVSFAFEGSLDDPLPRDEETAMHLYRIAHEAITNVRRHADADHVTVSLRRTDEALVLTVTDDGVGLPDDLDHSDGVGLRTMDHRAHVIGASLSVEAGDEGGTVVRCALPLDTARSE